MEEQWQQWYASGVGACQDALPVADLGGCICTPFWWVVMCFCVHNYNQCTSPSNDYAAVACSNNNQAQLHTHVSVPYWSPDVWLGLELLQDIQFGLPAILNNPLASYQSVETIIMCVMNALTLPEVGMATQNFSGALCVPVAEPPFVNF